MLRFMALTVSPFEVGHHELEARASALLSAGGAAMGTESSTLIRAAAADPKVGVPLSAIREFSDAEVVTFVQRLNQKKHQIDAELLLWLSEFDSRKLYREAACSSFFEYLTSCLGYSEDVAYRRMWCARLLREYPVVHELLRSGQIHMAALLLLKPLLTPGNHRELLMAAVGKSKRAVEMLVAARNPKSDAPSKIRRLPAPTMVRSMPAVSAAIAPPEILPSAPSGYEGVACAPLADAASRDLAAVGRLSESGPRDGAAGERLSAAQSASVGSTVPRCAPSRRARVSPSSAANYRVVFTASEQLKQKLDRAGELLSHGSHPSDLPALLERALDLLIEREQRRRFGSKRSRRQFRTATSEPRAAESQPPDMHGTESETKTERHVAQPNTPEHHVAQPNTPEHHVAKPNAPERHVAKPELRASRAAVAEGSSETSSAYIPAAVRREVWERDAGQCTYVNARGERCHGRHYVQFDHRIARAFGGSSTVENLRLRCAAHDGLAAEQVLGIERVRAAIAAAHERRRTGHDVV
jgi:hypothetical protein